MKDIVKIAGVQMDPKLTEVEHNLQQIEARTRQAAAAGARLVVFPECALTGYVFNSRAEAEPCMETVPGPATGRITALCKELGVWVVFGLLEVAGDRCYNTAVLVGPDGVAGHYRKNHLPCLGVDRFLDPGDLGFGVYDTPVGRIGLHICYDCNFPEAPRIMALKGAEILALPTNWPPGRGHIPRYVINTRAFENKVHVIAVDRVGLERGVTFYGHSKIANAWGDTLAEGSGDREEVLYAEVDLAEARQKHIVIRPGEFEVDFIRDRRPELYGDLVKPAPD